jgi:peptidoglycan/LPS O-acetylase OafA/YrhL
MPKPVDSSARYVPALDGLRAIAVMAVVAYHLNAGFAKGGLLGVGVFFTLSGYLITGILLNDWVQHASLNLRQFWIRRARRLLPALFLMLLVVAAWTALADSSQIDGVRRQVISSALYFENWSNIVVNGSYFARFAAPLPLDHLWSLSIEEQFYLIWPWLLLLMLRLFRSRTPMVILTLLAAALSVFFMAHLYVPGDDPTRVYEGTDTRAFGLLLGAALAMVTVPSRRGRSRLMAGSHPLMLDLAGVAALVGVFILFATTTSLDSFLYPTGMVLLSIATVIVIAAVIDPASLLGAGLGAQPLRWIGVRSYGIYLWHWPIMILWSGEQTNFKPIRATAQVAATLVIAELSWRFVEEPIRNGGLTKRPRSPAMIVRRRRLGTAATVSVLALLVLAAGGLAGALPHISRGHTTAPRVAQIPSSLTNKSDPSPSPDKPAGLPATKTTCRSVVYIGDSTSEGQVSSDYIPNRRLRLGPSLKRVGVRTLYPRISGARSTYETYDGIPNAATIAKQYSSRGYRGCWILAVGTNDVANSLSSPVKMAERIKRMMHIVGGDPVMWIGVVTLLSGGDYAESGMQQWNQTLLADCRRYPNMRIYNWPAEVKRSWFIPDGIHYYSPGYVARNRDFASGLVAAFPKDGAGSSGCLVD